MRRSLPPYAERHITCNATEEMKLDVYRHKDMKKPQPTLMCIHGGGSRNGIQKVNRG
jgi:hypothetical protein